MYSRHVAQSVSVYRRWRTVPCDRISGGTRIASRIRLTSSSAHYRLWDRCIAGPFRKGCNARCGNEASPSLRGASRSPFVSQSVLAFLSSDYWSSHAGVALPICCPLHCKICEASRTPCEGSKRRGHADEEANFCKAKGKECGVQSRLAPYKSDKGAKLWNT